MQGEKGIAKKSTKIEIINSYATRYLFTYSINLTTFIANLDIIQSNVNQNQSNCVLTFNTMKALNLR